MNLRSIKISLRKALWGARLIFTRYKAAQRGPIFVLGTGRSGTHFLNEILISHPSTTDLTGGKENSYVFHDVYETALGVRSEYERKLVKKYNKLKALAYPKILVDQSHPNIWLAESLSNNFPGAKFIAIIRDPFSVVYSTLLHDGVRGRLERWDQYPIPNRFLGIDLSNTDEYASMSIEQRAVLRWVSHVVRVEELLGKLNNNKILVLHYEDICLEPGEAVKKISSHLDLPELFDTPVVNESSLTKKDRLEEDKTRQIRSALERYEAEQTLGPFASAVFDRYLDRTQ